MTRTCEVCGQPFEAKRARICGPTCRKRKSRGIFMSPPPLSNSVTSGKKSSDPVVTSMPPVVTSMSLAPNSSPPGDSPLVVVVRRELEAAGVADTIDGQLALQLAVQMSGRETAGGMSSLSKEFSRVKAEALRSAVPTTADPVDELQARREAKMAAG